MNRVTEVLAMRGYVPTLLFLGVLTGWGFVATACGDDGVTLSENMEQVRDDPAIQANLEERRSTWEDCVADLGKVVCLGRFIESLEADIGACLDVYDPEGELCRLDLEVVAEVHGWSIPDRDRTVGLLRSDDTLEWETSCVEAADEFNCYTRHAVFLEDAFKLCDDLWGKDACEDVLGDLMAGLSFEIEERQAEIAPTVTVTAPNAAPSPSTRPDDSGAEDTTFEVFTASGLMAFASDLALELEDLAASERDSPGSAIYYAFQVSLHCFIAEEEFPDLWSRVGDACAEAESAGSAGIVGLVDSGRYELGIELADAIGAPAAGFLLRLTGPEAPRHEVLVTASLSAHAMALAQELEGIISPEGDSTPLAAIDALFELEVDCALAQDDAPLLWSHVSDKCNATQEIWEFIDTEQYEQALRLADEVAYASTEQLLSLLDLNE